MNEVMLTASLVVAIASLLLSLAFTYIPKVRVWWAGLPEENQQLGMLGLITTVCLGAGALTWTGVWVLIPPGTAGIVWLVLLWVQALVVNQGTYKATNKLQPADVKAVRVKRDAELDLNARIAALAARTADHGAVSEYYGKE
jgi:hypothetical protein